ncbi:hypothetical protein GCM10011409_39590 [Lentibacillus populi]|uniref:Uncharacterized protein n=1 Tax=Lentibacillus populi TaxID=1827502 RepID=A0A9W5X7B2_9BACI|nr:hypothetical protein GCM10011409_39590 [Lentibacillus populi]
MCISKDLNRRIKCYKDVSSIKSFIYNKDVLQTGALAEERKVLIYGNNFDVFSWNNRFDYSCNGNS